MQRFVTIIGNIQKAFSTVWAVLKISISLLKYPTFEGVFYVFVGKTSTQLEFLHIAGSALKN
jgi:hypothetical protein